jgi:hypothetical protein
MLVLTLGLEANLPTWNLANAKKGQTFRRKLLLYFQAVGSSEILGHSY